MPVIHLLASATRGIIAPPPPSASVYYVTTTGSDSNDGSNNTTEAWLTINYALIQADTPGDEVIIAAGTYIETSVNVTTSSVDTPNSGTSGSPIIIRAATADIGSVIIDSEDGRRGMTIGHSSWLTIQNLKFINSRNQAIVSSNKEVAGSPYFSSLASSQYSEGVIITGCHFLDTNGIIGSGINNCHIQCNNSVGWSITNNRMENVTTGGLPAVGGDHATGIQGYHMKDNFITNNTITGSKNGISIKDHWLNDDKSAVFEADIGYNYIEPEESAAVLVLTGNSEPAGDCDVHHNIMIGGTWGFYNLSAGASDVTFPGGQHDIRHNLIITDDANSRGLIGDRAVSFALEGNIILGSQKGALVTSANYANHVTIIESDYNVFDTVPANGNKVILQLNDGNIAYDELADWQAALSSESTHLDFDSPDGNSVASTPALILNDPTGPDYTLKAGSVAIGLLASGNDAGPYELGTETIGTTGGGAY